MIDKVTELSNIFIQRLRELETEERQLAEALERTRTARIAQEGAVQGLRILMERMGDGNNELSSAGE